MFSETKTKAQRLEPDWNFRSATCITGILIFVPFLLPGRSKTRTLLLFLSSPCKRVLLPGSSPFSIRDAQAAAQGKWKRKCAFEYGRVWKSLRQHSTPARLKKPCPRPQHKQIEPARTLTVGCSVLTGSCRGWRPSKSLQSSHPVYVLTVPVDVQNTSQDPNLQNQSWVDTQYSSTCMRYIHS